MGEEHNEPDHITEEDEAMEEDEDLDEEEKKEGETEDEDDLSPPPPAGQKGGLFHATADSALEAPRTDNNVQHPFTSTPTQTEAQALLEHQTARAEAMAAQRAADTQALLDRQRAEALHAEHLQAQELAARQETDRRALAERQRLQALEADALLAAALEQAEKEEQERQARERAEAEAARQRDIIELPVDLPVTLSPDQISLYAPWVFKIHNLDDSTPTSAVEAARKIIMDLPPIHLNPLNFGEAAIETDDRHQVITKNLMVYNANPQAGRNSSTAAVAFSPGEYRQRPEDNGSIDADDPRDLPAVMAAVIAAGHEALVSECSGNSKCTQINYEIKPPTGTPVNPAFIREHSRSWTVNTLKEAFEKVGCFVSADWNWTINKTNGTIRGGAADNSPGRSLKLVTDFPYHNWVNGWTLRLWSTKFIQPTYFTTLAWHIGSDVRLDDSEYKREINHFAAKFNKISNTKHYILNVRRSEDDRFILFDPSTATLAKYLSDEQMSNGHFPRVLTVLNEDPKNFSLSSIEADRRKRTAKTENRRDNSRSSDLLANRIEEKLNGVARGTAQGLGVVIRSMGSEALEGEERTILRLIDEVNRELAWANGDERLIYNLKGRQAKLNADLEIVREHLEQAKLNRATSLSSIGSSALASAGFTLATPPSRKRPSTFLNDRSRKFPATPATMLGSMSLGSRPPGQ